MHTVGSGALPPCTTVQGLGRTAAIALTAGAVAARHQHQLVHRRVGGKQGTACLQYRAPIGQAVAELIKSHAAEAPAATIMAVTVGSPFCGIQLRPLTLRYILIIIQGQLEKIH